jgi:hypothetical protein
MTMDPVTLVICCWALLAFVSRAADDLIATVRGTTPVRIQAARVRQGPTIRQALRVRIARWIARDPQEKPLPGAFRIYCSTLWRDSWKDAIVRHEDKRRARVAADTKPRPDPDNAANLHDCRGDCGVQVPEPEEWCGDGYCANAAPQPEPPEPAPAPKAEPVAPRPRCRTCRVTQVYRLGDECFGCMTPPAPSPPTPPPSDQEEQPVWDEDNPGPCATPGCSEPAACPEGLCYACDHGAYPCLQCRQRARTNVEGLCSWCVADNAAGGPPFTCSQCESAPVRRAVLLCADCVRDASRKPGDPPTETPEPAPAPDAHQEGPTPVTAPAFISSEVGSPREAVEWCDANQDVNDAAAEAISVAIENLRSRGIGEDFLNNMASALPPIEQASSAIGGARGEYLEWCVIQDAVLAEPGLRDALIGLMSADRL